MKDLTQEFADIKELEDIELGLNAARLMTVVARTPVAETLTDSDYQNAVEWIFEKLSGDVKAVRERLTADVCRRLDA